MINTKINTHTSPGTHCMGSILCYSVSWSWFSQIRIEIVQTANDTAKTSAMWNIAYASIKPNYIV